MIRNLISGLQNPNIIKEDDINKNNPKKITKHGLINISFVCNYYYYTMFHPLKNPRLEIYLERILYNLNRIEKLKSIESLYNLPKQFKIYYNDNENVYTFIRLDKTEHPHFHALGNFSEKLKDRFEFINLLCEYLKELDWLKTNSNKDERKKELIMRFYYVIILLMPFALGTASIAEVMLYSMSEYYLGKRVKINQECLLDVEALTLKFDIFYINCFNTDGTEYTPYLT